jgi:hypothetical protein
MHHCKKERGSLTKDGGQLGHTGGTTSTQPPCFTPGHVWLQTKPTSVAPSKETNEREHDGGERAGETNRNCQPSRAMVILSPSADKQSNSVQDEKQFGGGRGDSKPKSSIYAHELFGKNENLSYLRS